MDKSKILEELKNTDMENPYREYFLVKYKDPSYEQVIRILLEDGIIPLNLLETAPITYLWGKYDWAKEMILKNIDNVVSNNDYNKLSTIVNLAMGEKEQFIQLCKSIFGSEDIVKRVLLIDILLDYGFPACKELVISPLYQKKSEDKKMESNSIFDILEYRLDDYNIKEILLNHYEELFESAIYEKMQILSSVLELSPNINSPLIQKYGLLLSYFKQISLENQKWADEILSSVINVQKEKDLLEELRKKFHQDKLVLKDSGSFSVVLGTKEWVLKICNQRITWDCPRKSFLLNENEFRKILDENGVPIAGIEWQPYLPQTNKKITKELIYKYLVEFRNQNLTLADSSALRYNSKNFRFLKNTKHLQEQGISLPDWFIEDPLVSIDIDAIYNRGENEEADRQMDEAISNFKK